MAAHMPSHCACHDRPLTPPFALRSPFVVLWLAWVCRQIPVSLYPSGGGKGAGLHVCTTTTRPARLPLKGATKVVRHFAKGVFAHTPADARVRQLRRVPGRLHRQRLHRLAHLHQVVRRRRPVPQPQRHRVRGGQRRQGAHAQGRVRLQHPARPVPSALRHEHLLREDHLHQVAAATCTRARSTAPTTPSPPGRRAARAAPAARSRTR